MVLAFFFIVLTFILLSWSQNKPCVTLDRYVILALNNVAVWSSYAVINFIGNHFETHHVLSSFYVLKNPQKQEYGPVFWYRMRGWVNFDLIPSRSMPRNKIVCWKYFYRLPPPQTICQLKG